MKRIFCGWFWFYLLFFAGLSDALAQISQDTSTGSYHNLSGYYLSQDVNKSLEGQLLMRVNVWGEVTKPGTYEVPDQTDLVSLISTAGGPTESAKLNKVKLVRNHYQKKEIFKINLKKYMEDGSYNNIPKVFPGDTVVIPKSGFFRLAKYMSFLYNVAVIAATVKIYTD